MEKKEKIFQSFTIESFLLPLLTRPKIAQVVKWSVYALLLVNFAAFFVDDWQVYVGSLDENAATSDLIEAFSTTIDMAAWVGLVFLFELETYSLPDEVFKPWLTRTLHFLRMVCYLSIFLAAYSYTTAALDYLKVEAVEDFTTLCEVADQGLSLQLDSIDYAAITTENCDSLTDDENFYRIPGEVGILSESAWKHSRWIDWIGVANAYVWILVVFLLEVQVRMAERDRFGGRVLDVTRRMTTVLYGFLITFAAIWLFNGYPLWTWDSFLWIAGFWAIELNMAEWEKERKQELVSATA